MVTLLRKLTSRTELIRSRGMESMTWETKLGAGATSTVFMGSFWRGKDLR